MKYYLYLMGLLYVSGNYGACTPLVLGRTTERLPNENSNEFLQKEMPLNTVLQECDYGSNGVVINYPIGWFNGVPRVQVSVQPKNADSAIQYSIRIVANSLTSTTIGVFKYKTNEQCSVVCTGGVCANSPYCTDSECVATPNDDGTCTTICTCAQFVTPEGAQCISICNNCSGLCEGACFGFGTGAMGGTFGSCEICNGTGYDCSTCTNTMGSGICDGTGTNCLSGCDGICTSFTGFVYGVIQLCNGTCFGNGPCSLSATGNCRNNAVCSQCGRAPVPISSTLAYGNGPAGSCYWGVRGYCSESNAAICSGTCSICVDDDPRLPSFSGRCNMDIPTGGECIGYCEICIGTCSGTTYPRQPILPNVYPVCMGEVHGQCNGPVPETPWNGYCELCVGECTGNGDEILGAQCESQCTQNPAVAVSINEVSVHVYAIDVQ